MKIRVNKKSIGFKEIYNESQMEMVNEVAEKSNCEVAYTDMNTTAKVTGDLSTFITNWNLS